MTAARCGLFIFFILILASSTSALDREHLRWVRSKPPIKKIEIEGNSVYSFSDLRKRMYSKTHGFWSALRKDRRIFVQRETLGRDTLEIKYIYLKEGFLDVAVAEEFIINENDSSAIVRVTISEGRQYFIGSRSYTGEYQKGHEWHFDRISKRLKLSKPFDIFEVRSVVFDIKTYMANSGYPYAEVSYSIDSAGPTEFDDILFHIRADSLVHFGEVTISGSNYFPKSAAQRELKIKKGNIYRRQDILDSQRRLLESGYFTTVQFTQENNGGNKLIPDFVLHVRERNPRYTTITTGAGQSDNKDLVWNLSARFGKRNFFGSRRYELLADYSFTLGGDAGLTEHRYRVRYTEPWFFKVRMPLILTGEYQPKLQDPNRNFDRESYGISAETNRRFGLKIRTTLGLEFEFVNISGVPDDEIQLLKREEGISARRKIYGAFRRDSRDDLFVPRRGVLVEINPEYFGGFLGGDDSFAKIQASWSTYQRLKTDFISATRFKVGWSKAFAETEAVPIDEALFLGGANTIRGFSEESLGPIGPEGEVEGASYNFVFNQELRWKTVQVFSYIPLLRDLFKSIPIWQSVFFDMGNGFRNLDDIKPEALAYGYGTGVQFISPAGPIRLDYARRIQTRRIEFDTRWHFTILYAF